MVNLEYRDASGMNVAVAGSFSDWQPRQMKDKNNDGVYRCRLLLEPGEYQYKFLVEEQWRSDPLNPNFVPNEYGSLNSVLVVVKR
jgi:1,4-alpha-glucan branching enzyme